MHKCLFDATCESMKAMRKLKGESDITPEQSMEVALWHIAIALSDIADSLRDQEDEEDGQ